MYPSGRAGASGGAGVAFRETTREVTSTRSRRVARWRNEGKGSRKVRPEGAKEQVGTGSRTLVL